MSFRPLTHPTQLLHWRRSGRLIMTLSRTLLPKLVRLYENGKSNAKNIGNGPRAKYRSGTLPKEIWRCSSLPGTLSVNLGLHSMVRCFFLVIDNFMPTIHRIRSLIPALLSTSYRSPCRTTKNPRMDCSPNNINN